MLRDAAGDLSVFLAMTQPTWLSNGGSAEYLVFAFTGSCDGERGREGGREGELSKM